MRRLAYLFFLVAACETPKLLPQDPPEILSEDPKVPSIVPPMDAQAAPERVDPCPNGVMVENGKASFCIDRYEAPNVEGATPFHGQGAHEAEAWCQAHGEELCTQDQWVMACQGPQHNPYPYGKTYKRGICNDDKTWIGPVPWLKMGDKEEWARVVERLYQGEPSGHRPACKTESGIYDLTGNVAEWVKEPKNVHGFVVKGCYWSGCLGGVPSCGFVNPAHAPEFKSYEFGFRCCRKVVK